RISLILTPRPPSSHFLHYITPPPSISTLFPYTTLFRSVFGSHQFNSEDLLAYELGYRVQATKNLSLDIATFYNNYSNLRTAEPRSEEHTSESSHRTISYAVFCLKKKKQKSINKSIYTLV